MIGLYSPGTSFVHRTPALVKLLVLSAGMVLIALSAEFWHLAGSAIVLAVLYAASGVPLRAAWQQIGPVLWILVFAFPLQALFAGWAVAGFVAGRLVIAVALAALFTLTTPVSAVLDAFQTILRPFRRWVDADRVGLLVALTIRCIPLIADIVTEVLDARRARGTVGSLRALAVPVVVRSLYAADAIGEALVARGVDD